MRTAALPKALTELSDEVRSTVAHNLDATLKNQRWSRRAAATALGLSHTYVNSRAAGDTELSASDLAMFAEFLSVPVASFFTPIQGDSEPRGEGSNLRTLVPKVAGSTPVGGTLISFPTHSRDRPERDTLAPVTAITGERVA